MSACASLPMGGRVVLVTRPPGQGGALRCALEALGAEALLLPTIRIEALPQADRRVREAVVEGVDVAVFTSANAARIAWPLLPAGQGLPAHVAAVGEGTAAALRESGCSIAIAVPACADSEGLLALPLLARVAGRRVVVFTGEGGRGLLADALAARGARTHVAAVYRRALPAAPEAGVLARLSAGGVHAVTVSSAEGGRNLYALLPAGIRPAVARLPHVVPHRRVGEALREAGVNTVLVAPGGDAALAGALAEHFAGAWVGDQA